MLCYTYKRNKIRIQQPGPSLSGFLIIATLSGIQDFGSSRKKNESKNIKTGLTIYFQKI